MENHHILGFLWLENIFLDLLIGCGGQKNCHRDGPILFYVFSSCGFGPIK
jgi:hypothetical protein